ncbi:MAG: DUF2784 domain-containing protein [Tepidisphaeraceae bacterium]
MNLYRITADFVLILHTAVIVFILFGLVAILLGVARKWEWVRNFYFRVAHLLAIAYVVAQTFLGIACPLTILENHLRVRAGQDPYAEAGCIQFWLHRLIFFDAEPWVFTLCYASFGLLVAATMWLAPPRRPGFVEKCGTTKTPSHEGRHEEVPSELIP